MQFKDLSLEEIINKIKSGEVSRKEIFDYFLKRIEKYDVKLQCFNFVNKEGLSNNEWSLFWAPIAMKDLYCEKWIPTTGSSKMLEDFVPPYDATIIKKLNKEAMSSIGKVTMDQFAMWASWESSALKKAVNPWWTNRIPGGSSSWSAVAVAAWLAPASLWTDTWGSLRQPASLCWVVWFRPSYGRNSRFWIFPMASSLDCPGTITKTVKDAWILYEIMNWEDPLENTSLPGKDIINPKIWETQDLKWVKIGVVKEYFWEWLDSWVKDAVKNSIKELEKMWAEIKEISLPMTKYAIASYYIIVPAEVSTNLWRLDGIRYGHISDKEASSMDNIFQNNRGEGLWQEAKRRTILWSYVLSAGFYDAYFKKASQVRTLIIEDFNKAFKEVDVIIWPASPSVAGKMWEESDDPLKMYLADMYTVPASLAWLPGISVPCWFAKTEDEEKEEMPVGLQIIAQRLEEERLLEIANVYEKNTSWKEKMVPKGFDD